ncbi:c-type cytochrome [Falsiroseomonas sp. CW058]|uniref:c-type cytochrome n=1 Tax=Falsiroseomonas sp. CW058 TaxID=3388664 RepID=UPI003D3204D7
MRGDAMAASAAACVVAMLCQGPAAAQPRPHEPGAEAYRLACAQCHGPMGRGDGPLRSLLNIQAPDLTTLSQRNGGEFPFLRIMQVVDGRTQVGAHGTASMPAWGAVFSLEASDRLEPQWRETYIRGRIVELVGYVQSLQR